MMAGRIALRAWPLIPPMTAAVIVTLVATQGSEYVDSILIIGLVNLLFVIGLYSFAGTSGVFSFGHIAFAAIGAYSAAIFAIPPETKSILFSAMPTALVNVHTGSLMATLIGGGVAALAGALTSPLMRLNGLSASLATFALLIIVHAVAQNLNQVTNGLSGMASVPTTTTAPKLLVWSLICMVLVYAFQESRWGLRLRASREDEVAAQAYGVGVFFERRLAWTLSVFIMGIAGALYGQFLGTFNADAFYLDISFLVIAMLVVGGRTSLAGAVFGAITIALVAEGLRHVENGFTVAAVHVPGRAGIEALGLSIVMVAVLIVRPNGMTGGREITWPFTRAIRHAKDDPQSTRRMSATAAHGGDA